MHHLRFWPSEKIIYERRVNFKINASKPRGLDASRLDVGGFLLDRLYVLLKLLFTNLEKFGSHIEVK